MTPKQQTHAHTHNHSHEEKLISSPGKSKYLEQLAQAAENVDPTHTKTLRRDYMADVYKRFRHIKGLIRKAVVDLDVLDLGQGPNTALQDLPDPGDFKFTSDSEKVSAFNNWLDGQMYDGVLRPPEDFPDRWQKQYVQRGYNSGVRQAQRKMRQAGMDVPSIDDAAFRNIFNQPIHKEKLELLYTRNFQALKGITNDVDKQISQTLTNGLSKGYNPRKMARELNDRVDSIGITRARTMARTETIYTHNEAALTRYEQMGVKEVTAEVEWLTAGDRRVCPDCGALGGSRYKLKEARGILPYHPNCRCTWVPATHQTPSGSTSPGTTTRYEDPQKWKDNLTDDQAKALRDWSTDTYQDIRRLQRGSIKSGPKKDMLQNKLEDMEDALDTAPTYNGKAYRGLNGVSDDQLETLAQEGAKYKQEAFASWSQDEEVAKGFAYTTFPDEVDSHSVVFEVDVNNFKDITKASVHAENEVLAEPGMEFRVTDVVKEQSEGEGTFTRIILEMVI